MARLNRAMTLTRWSDGLSTVTTWSLWVPIPGTQVERKRGGRYDEHCLNFKIQSDSAQSASLLRDIADTGEALYGESRRVAREGLAECTTAPSMPKGAALDAVITAAGYQAPTARPRATVKADDAPARGPWQSAMPADVADPFGRTLPDLSPVAGITQRRRVWCKRTERGHNAIVRRKARVEALIDGKGTPCWDGLPALMRKVPA